MQHGGAAGGGGVKTLVACMGLLIFYGIIQQQLPCNFSITCLMGRPTIKRALFLMGGRGSPELAGTCMRRWNGS